MNRLAALGRGVWEFVFGDDWTIAAGLAVVLGAVAWLAHHGVSAYWLLPPAVVALLAASVGRAARR